ncbi:hypothetical protein J4032_01610 [Streptomyces formicae]|uniref:Uncharacterized protein n=1 Tax=Streptomyces formicae TaxID=1616117 RepID=A0ABY3WFF8_9ACTN|nr:hypothetical protein [Streptomyces formicae]UNM10376.1 hypothetical protein J4032_01610 [Streptomyces formicae]
MLVGMRWASSEEAVAALATGAAEETVTTAATRATEDTVTATATRATEDTVTTAATRATEEAVTATATGTAEDAVAALAARAAEEAVTTTATRTAEEAVTTTATRTAEEAIATTATRTGLDVGGMVGDGHRRRGGLRGRHSGGWKEAPADHCRRGENRGEAKAPAPGADIVVGVDFTSHGFSSSIQGIFCWPDNSRPLTVGFFSLR